jgi:hypothetical protein
MLRKVGLLCTPPLARLRAERDSAITAQMDVNPGVDMTTIEAIAFGIMLAWTPGLIILAFLLWDVPELEED